MLEFALGRAPPQGALIAATAAIRAPRPPAHGFDERQWLRRQGIHCVLRISAWQAIGRRGGVGGIGDRVHAWLGGAITPGMTGERRAVLVGIVLGDDAGLSATLKQRFRAAGLYHLLAVTGQNVVLVAAGVLLAAWSAHRACLRPRVDDCRWIVQRSLEFLTGCSRFYSWCVAAELKPAYLIGGTDLPKVTRAVERLRARFESDAVERHRAGEISGEDAVAACNALGLFAGAGRLIVVEAVEAWKAADVAAIAAYVKLPSPDTTLALVGGELKKDSALAKAIAGAGELLIWDVPQKSLPSWVAEQFKLHGVSADIDACRLLIELVGEDLYELASEVDKITTWAQPGATITDHEIEELVAPRAEASGFALTDAWGQRDAAGVLRASEALIERSGDPRSKSIPMLVRQLTSHVARVRACQVFESQGISAKDAAVQMKRHPFYVGKLYTQARNFSAEELRSVTVRLAELDFALKGGSRVANDLELERALIDVTARREPAARNAS